MRIKSVKTTGIGGLVPGEVEIPDAPVVAVAGPNGSGKSKFLNSLMSPWIGDLPSSADVHTLRTDAARIDVVVEFEDLEIETLTDVSLRSGWGEAPVPREVTLGIQNSPMVRVEPIAKPNLPILNQFTSNPELLDTVRTLNPVYIPAERRLVSRPAHGIDLGQLDDLAITTKMVTDRRTYVQEFGRMDDDEFESYAMALCFEESLPEDADSSSNSPRITWSTLQEAVNAIIAPKQLLPLTQGHADRLRIRTPNGSYHAVEDLSSGERQALVIVSRVMKAGSEGRVVVIDEPDAYLHPQLSRRLIGSLMGSMGHGGQLILATHSPSILDHLPPAHIIQLSHSAPPQPLSNEDSRLSLYRSTGFKASALTQSEFLIITEGQSDSTLLSHIFPHLASASIHIAGGRSRVLSDVMTLRKHNVPVHGVIDADCLASEVPAEISDSITQWPKADIEAMFLSSDASLSVMLQRGLAKKEYSSIEALRRVLDTLREEQTENAIAELAQRLLRTELEFEWPTPKGEQPVERLIKATEKLRAMDSELVDSLVAQARLMFEEEEEPWRFIRGKYIVNQFARLTSSMRTGSSLLESIALAKPEIPGFDVFQGSIDQLGGSSPMD